MGCLYQLVAPSGKSYIGISKNTAEQRWLIHVRAAKCGRQGALPSAIRKYGPDSFKVKTLAFAVDWAYLCDLERKAIFSFGTKAPYGYNLTSGGDGVVGYELTDFDRTKISVAQKARYSREDQRKKLIEQGKKGAAISLQRAMARRVDGKPPWQVRAEASRSRMGSAERSKRISDGIKKALLDPEVRARIVAGNAKRDKAAMVAVGKKNLGRKHGPASEARKQAIRERQLVAWADPIRRAERVRSMNEKRAARNQDPATAEKIASTLKALWTDPEYRARMVAIRRKRMQHG